MSQRYVYQKNGAQRSAPQ
ncbi:unnamed protein product, partial [Rotaria sp. Silwood2]